MNPINRSDFASNGEPSTPFTGWVESAKPHICAFFNTTDEEYRVLLPFIKEGFERGEKAFHVVAPGRQQDHLQRLEAAGIDVDGAKAGQLELCDWEEAYFPDGRFDQVRMLEMWQRVLEGAERQGFPRTRLVAHMEWSLEAHEGVNDLIEYEARFNLVHTDRDPVICAYDLRKFPGDVVIDVMRTHPMIIIGGALQVNPFYVPAEKFIEELRERQSSHCAPRNHP